MKFVIAVIALLISGTAWAGPPNPPPDFHPNGTNVLEGFADGLNSRVPCGKYGAAAKAAMLSRLHGRSEYATHQELDDDDNEVRDVVHAAYQGPAPKGHDDVIIFTVQTNLNCAKRKGLLP